MNKLFSILFLFIGMASSLFAAEITKVEPANWWVGMNDTKVELLVYGKDLCGASVELEADDVQLLSVENGIALTTCLLHWISARINVQEI